MLSGRSRRNCCAFFAARGPPVSATADKMPSKSTVWDSKDQVPVSPRASTSRSLTSRPMRVHSRQMVWRRVSSCSGDIPGTEALAERTASGDFNSWDAAATNSVCRCMLSEIGRAAWPDSHQDRASNTLMPHISSPTHLIRICRICPCSCRRSFIMTAVCQPLLEDRIAACTRYRSP